MAKKKYKATTDSAHGRETAPNLLRQKFAVAVPDLVFHSDKGSQYASDDFKKALEDVKALQNERQRQLL